MAFIEISNKILNVDHIVSFVPEDELIVGDLKIPFRINIEMIGGKFYDVKYDSKEKRDQAYKAFQKIVGRKLYKL